MAHEVFISYSSKNKPVADAVCARLEFHKIRCWIAPRDVLPGSNWGAAIIDAIGGSRIVVLVFSSEANTSDAVRRELERATSSSKIIIPFRLEDIRISKELEFFIAGSHWLDAFTPPLEDHIDRLAGAINGFLKGEAWSSSEPNRAAAGERPGGIFQKVWTESWKRVLSVGPRSKNAPTDFWKWLFGGDAKPPAIVNHIIGGGGPVGHYFRAGQSHARIDGARQQRPHNGVAAFRYIGQPVADAASSKVSSGNNRINKPDLNNRKRNISAEIQTPTRRFAEPSSDPWSLEASPSSAVDLGSAILTDPFGEIRIVFLVAC
jgi:hypothetical protein